MEVEAELVQATQSQPGLKCESLSEVGVGWGRESEMRHLGPLKCIRSYVKAKVSKKVALEGTGRPNVTVFSSCMALKSQERE